MTKNCGAGCTCPADTIVPLDDCTVAIDPSDLAKAWRESNERVHHDYHPDPY